MEKNKDRYWKKINVSKKRQENKRRTTDHVVHQILGQACEDTRLNRIPSTSPDDRWTPRVTSSGSDGSLLLSLGVLWTELGTHVMIRINASPRQWRKKLRVTSCREFFLNDSFGDATKICQMLWYLQ